ncbi:MAG: GAF domain-containing protein, partial [Candidatus Rokubacteria bacterium]|nr:GAF domain-containing protein [Candidatus Rokubacteria bacterium]
CGSDVAAVALRDRDGAMSLQYLAGARSGGAVGRRVEDGLGTGGQVLATGRPFRTSNCAADPRITRAPLDAADAEEITAEMVVPVTNEGRIDGLLYVSNRAPRAFTDRDETVLSRLAEHAALAITNAQLFAREQAAREASEVSEERYRNLVESLDAIVWEADAATGALSFVSGSTETILGYPVERWLAEPGFVTEHLHPDDREATVALAGLATLAEHLHPDDREATVALAGLATLAAGDHRLEYRMLAADGRTVWIHDTVRVVRDGAGRARRLRGVKVDITNLKRAQQYQEIQFGVTRLLAQATSLDEALPVLFERLCRSLGWEFGEVWRVDAAADVLRRGGAWHEPSFDIGGFLEATRELAFARGVGLPGRVWQDGGPVWVSDVTTDARFARSALAATAGIHSAFAFPIRSAREVIGVLVFFSRRVYPPDEHLLKVVDDLGLQIGQFIERRQAEEALERSEQEHRSLVEGAAYGICRTSLDGRFQTVNPALVAMLGYASADELLAVNAAKDVFAREDDRAGLIEAYRATGRIREHDAQWKRPDGRVITVRLTGRRLLDGAGALAGFEKIVEDVTDRRQLEEQLRQSQKMEAIGQLAGGVAHDFNNLLTVIIGRSELLLQRLGPDPAPRRDVSLVQKTATRAAGLTRQLLAFSRKQLLQPKVLDLDEIVRGMGKLLRPLIGEHIELTIRSAPGIHRVNADPGQLEQVLMNLAVNARDAMPDGGRLTIETADREVETGPADAAGARPRQPHVLLAVSDTGSGMDAATRSRVFDPFFTTKEPGKGTGLGLSTVYGIVAQSGGLIEVESEPGLGTTFKIFLPRVAVAVDAAAEEAAKRPPLRGSETILLVEDEEGVRELAREILVAHGYTVLEAAGPTEALRLAEAHEGVIHLLLTDVVMPVMRGDALAKRIAPLRPATRVLYITGYVDGQLVSPTALGPDLVLLPKPFTPDALLLRVRDVLTA